MAASSIGPYKVIREIGEDRVGQVFEAVDSTRKKRVIIKSLKPEAADRPEIVSRLYSEAQTLALLNHPHIARLFGFIRASNKFYLVMEFVEGQSLRTTLKEKGRLDANLAFAIFHQISAAVKFAHDLGVVHGDLKPSNIIVANFAQIKVLDFAIATILGDRDLAPRVSSAPYMAPERIRGDAVGLRSDIYSLGVLLYECIIGRVPFTGNDPTRTRHPANESTFLMPSLLLANCPYWLDSFFQRALAPAPEDRFQSITAMTQAMGSAVPPSRRRISPKPARAWIERRIQRVASAPSALLAGADTVLESLASRLIAAAVLTRQKQASATEFLLRGVTALNPWTWTKRGVSNLQSWARRVQRQLRSAARDAYGFREKLQERFAGFAEANWKRYVVLATLLTSAIIETFIFGGTNTLLNPALLNPDFNSIPALNRTGAAQSILEPLNVQPPRAIEVASEPEPQPKLVKRPNRAATAAERPKGAIDGLHHEALNSRRTVTYRAEAENHFNQPAVQEARVNEPSRRNPEKNQAKVQLNVRWEN